MPEGLRGAISGRLQRPDAVKRFSQRVFLHLKVVVRLKVDPELRTRTEVATQTERGVSRDAALAVHDLIDPTRRTPIATATLFWVMLKGSMNSP